MSCSFQKGGSMEGIVSLAVITMGLISLCCTVYLIKEVKNGITNLVRDILKDFESDNEKKKL